MSKSDRRSKFEDSFCFNARLRFLSINVLVTAVPPRFDFKALRCILAEMSIERLARSEISAFSFNLENLNSKFGRILVPPNFISILKNSTKL